MRYTRRCGWCLQYVFNLLDRDPENERPESRGVLWSISRLPAVLKLCGLSVEVGVEVGVSALVCITSFPRPERFFLRRADRGVDNVSDILDWRLLRVWGVAYYFAVSMCGRGSSRWVIASSWTPLLGTLPEGDIRYDISVNTGTQTREI